MNANEKQYSPQFYPQARHLSEHFTHGISVAQVGHVYPSFMVGLVKSDCLLRELR